MLKTLILYLAIVLLAVALVTGCAKAPATSNNTAPEFTLKDLNGSSVTLSGLKGRPVLLNFWATWCPPCRGELPYLQQLYDDDTWRARGLVIFGVDIQEPAETVAKFMADNTYSFTVLLDTGGQAARLYNVASIPTTYIIDKDGIIMDRRVGAFVDKAQIDQTLRGAITGQ